MMPKSHAATDVSADSWTHGDQHRCGHLHDPDEEHERVTRDRQQPRDHGSEILIPVGEEVRELVESRQKGRHDEPDVQDLICLVGRAAGR